MEDMDNVNSKKIESNKAYLIGLIPTTRHVTRAKRTWNYDEAQNDRE